MSEPDSMAKLRHRLLTSSRPLPSIPVVRCHGSWIYRADGTRVLDGSSGVICVNVGHGNVRVASRIAEQLPVSAFAGPGALWPAKQLELVEKLTAAVGRPEDSVALTTSGTAAIELAIAIAKLVARARGGEGRRHVLTSNLSYHGSSALTLALSGSRRRRPHPDDAFGLTPAFPAPYPPAHQGHACVASCAETVAEAIDACGEQTVAAVLVEPVNGTTGGAFVPPDGYLARLAEICRSREVVLIHDEVLTGLGRTGLPLASHHWPASAPDICVLSKGLGAGYTSVGAVLVSPELARTLGSSGPLPLMGTMAATPLQAAICLAVLEELESLGALLPQPRGAEVADIVRRLGAAHPAITDVRGLGYYHGWELRDGLLWHFLREVEKRGVLLYPFGGYREDGGGEGVIVAPPLNSSADELAHLACAVSGALDALDS